MSSLNRWQFGHFCFKSVVWTQKQGAEKEQVQLSWSGKQRWKNSPKMEQVGKNQKQARLVNMQEMQN